MGRRWGRGDRAAATHPPCPLAAAAAAAAAIAALASFTCASGCMRPIPAASPAGRPAGRSWRRDPAVLSGGAARRLSIIWSVGGKVMAPEGCGNAWRMLNDAWRAGGGDGGAASIPASD